MSPLGAVGPLQETAPSPQWIMAHFIPLHISGDPQNCHCISSAFTFPHNPHTPELLFMQMTYFPSVMINQGMSHILKQVNKSIIMPPDLKTFYCLTSIVLL